MCAANRIIGLFPALEGIGGVQEAGRLSAMALAQIALRRGWGVDFLSLNDSPNGSFSWSGQEVRFRGFGRSKVRFVYAVASQSARQACFIFAFHPHLAMVAGPLRSINPRARLTIMSHGAEVWQPLSPLRRRAFLSADIFTAPSRYTLDQIVRMQGADKRKTRFLPWCLSPSLLELAERRKDLPTPADFPDGLVVMTATRLATEEGYKGVDQLIRAVAQTAAKVPSLHLVVIGSGNDLPRHLELTRELHVLDRVRFFQTLSREELAGCYSRCDIFALPSSGEGFGLVFLDAMAFAKPVIGAAAGGVTEIVEHGENGLLVAPNNVEQLVESLERLLASESLRSELGHKGAAVVRSKFQFSSFRSRLDDVLNELVRS